MGKDEIKKKKPKKPMSKKQKNMRKKWFQKLSKKIKILIYFIIIILILSVASAIYSKIRYGSISVKNIQKTFTNIFVGKEGKTEIVTESDLESVLEISELSTIESEYNAIAKSYDSDGEIKYYVSYKGRVVAGIDFSKIEKDVNNKDKIIKIILPETEIQSTVVDFESMEYIFVYDKYNTETVSQEAYEVCKQDLSDKAAKEENLLSLAKENAKSVIEALVSSWIQQIDSDYKIIIE